MRFCVFVLGGALVLIFTLSLVLLGLSMLFTTKVLSPFPSLSLALLHLAPVLSVLQHRENFGSSYRLWDGIKQRIQVAEGVALRRDRSPLTLNRTPPELLRPFRGVWNVSSLPWFACCLLSAACPAFSPHLSLSADMLHGTGPCIAWPEIYTSAVVLF